MKTLNRKRERKTKSKKSSKNKDDEDDDNEKKYSEAELNERIKQAIIEEKKKIDQEIRKELDEKKILKKDNEVIIDKKEHKRLLDKEKEAETNSKNIDEQVRIWKDQADAHKKNIDTITEMHQKEINSYKIRDMLITKFSGKNPVNLDHVLTIAGKSFDLKDNSIIVVDASGERAKKDNGVWLEIDDFINDFATKNPTYFSKTVDNKGTQLNTLIDPKAQSPFATQQFSGKDMLKEALSEIK